jgi:hypothetical protein
MTDSAGEVHGAASDMASKAIQGVASTPAPVLNAGASGGGAGGAGGGSGGGSGGIVIEAGAIVISGQGKDWAEVTEEMIAAVMERLGIMAGVT